MKVPVALLAALLLVAGCTSHSDRTWIDTAIGRVPAAVHAVSTD